MITAYLERAAAMANLATQLYDRGASLDEVEQIYSLMAVCDATDSRRSSDEWSWRQPVTRTFCESTWALLLS